MSDHIEVNVAGRLMLLLTRQCLLDNRSLVLYQSAVTEAVRKRLADAGVRAANGDVEHVLDEQLALLEAALNARSKTVSAASAAGPVPDEPAIAAAEPVKQATAEAQPAVESGEKPRAPRASSGYVPVVKSLEEKLQDERKPIQTLLREDCVRAGLVNGKAAEQLIQGMAGKTCQQAEQDIVEHLRQTLQDQVKTFIRKVKGGPWANPRTQEDLRQDIHAARSVRSVLMLARQVVKEHQVWQQENRRGGILGLFSPRKHIV